MDTDVGQEPEGGQREEKEIRGTVEDAITGQSMTTTPGCTHFFRALLSQQHHHRHHLLSLYTSLPRSALG